MASLDPFSSSSRSSLSDRGADLNPRAVDRAGTDAGLGLIAQASQSHFEQQVQQTYDGYVGFQRSAVDGAQRARELATLGNISAGTRNELQAIATNLDYWAGVYEAYSGRLEQGVTPADLNNLRSQLQNDTQFRAGAAQYGAHPVVGNLKRLENQIRNINQGFAGALDQVAGNDRLNEESRAYASGEARSLREFNGQEGRIVNTPQGERPVVYWDVLREQTGALLQLDRFLTAAGEANQARPSPASDSPSTSATAAASSDPTGRVGQEIPRSVRVGNEVISYHFDGVRLVETRRPVEGSPSGSRPLSDYLLELRGQGGAAAPDLARVDAALGETLAFGAQADQAWRDRPGQLGQRAFDAAANALGQGIGNADQQFQTLRNEYDGHWSKLLTARNDAVNALNRGDQSALADANQRINQYLGLTVSSASSIQAHLATVSERGVTVTLLPLELTRGLVVGGGAALAGTASAPTAAVFPPAPFLIAGATGAGLEATTRPVFGFAAENLFGIDPETYQNALPRLDVSLGTAFLGGALTPLRLASPLQTFGAQAAGNSAINLSGAYLEDGRLSFSEAAFSVGAGVGAGAIDGLQLRGQQNAVAQQLDLAAANMLTQPLGSTARLGNVELRRFETGVELRFDDGAAVLRTADGRYQLSENNLASLPDAVAQPGNNPDPAPANRGQAEPPSTEDAPASGTPPGGIPPRNTPPAAGAAPDGDGDLPAFNGSPFSFNMGEAVFGTVQPGGDFLGRPFTTGPVPAGELSFPPGSVSFGPGLTAPGNADTGLPITGLDLTQGVVPPGVNPASLSSASTPASTLFTDPLTGRVIDISRPEIAIPGDGRVTRVDATIGSATPVDAYPIQAPTSPENRQSVLRFIRQEWGLDLRVGAGARLYDPLTGDNLMRGNVFVGLDTLDMIWADRGFLAERLLQGDRASVGRYLSNALGIGGRAAESLLDPQVGRYLLDTGLGSNSALQFKYTTLRDAAVSSVLGGEGPFILRTRPESLDFQPAASPDVSPTASISGRLELNVTEVTLQPGQVDVFGNRFENKRYFRAETDIPLDKVMTEVYFRVPDEVPLIGGLSGERRAETTSRYTIPAGSILPEEFVRNINQRVGGVDFTLSLPVQNAEAATRLGSGEAIGGVTSDQVSVRQTHNGELRISSIAGRDFIGPNGGIAESALTLDVNFFEGDPIRGVAGRVARSQGGEVPLLPANQVDGVPNLFRELTDPSLHSDSQKVRFKINLPGTGIRFGEVAKVEFPVYIVREGQTSRPGNVVAQGGNATITYQLAGSDGAASQSSFEVPAWFARTVTREINSVPVGGQASIRSFIESRMDSLTPEQRTQAQAFLADGGGLSQVRDQRALSPAARDQLLQVFASLTSPAASLPPP